MDRSRGGLTGSMLDGRYRIGSVIARGGMSTVYRGVDTRLDRPVAVKVMASQYTDDPAFVTRFSREARLAAGLSDPGIVAVYDHGRDDGHAFLVMELVDGGTLRDVLHQRGAQPIGVAVSVLNPLLQALAVAHRAGLVHRDVKPENVLIDSRGRVKVADFGLVRAVTSHTMATGDVILGTVAYLSPEQVETGASDPRSDVYSAGIVAWELLAGRPPFTGDNAMSVAYQHVHGQVPLIGDHVRDVPAELEDLLADATARDPEHRPRDAGTFAARLSQVCARGGVKPLPIPVPQSSPDMPSPAAGVADHRPARTAAAPPVTHSATAVATGGNARAAAPTANGRGPQGTQMAGRSAHPPTASAPRADEADWPPIRRKRWTKRIVLLVLLLLLGAAAAVGGWWLGDGRWANAPTTVGLTRAEAEQKVRDAGLIPQVAMAMDNVATAGTVSGSQPPAGARILRGSAVNIVVSSGKPRVPTIAAGSTVDQALQAISRAGLRHGTPDTTAYHDTVPQGAVVGTDPAAGSAVNIGGSVALIISLGPQRFTVPTVAGKSAEDASNKLLVAGFRVGKSVDGFDAASPDGTVIGTKPAAGQQIPRSQSVQLVVNASLTVPDVAGRSVDEATATLTTAGYQVTVGDPEFNAERANGKTIRTEPAAGTRIGRTQRAITLIPSNAVAVPQVSGLAADSAESVLTAQGFVVRFDAWFGLASGSVWSQHPTAGTLVEPGSTVVLTTP